jgi:hypothetical protein
MSLFTAFKFQMDGGIYCFLTEATNMLLVMSEVP